MVFSVVHRMAAVDWMPSGVASLSVRTSLRGHESSHIAVGRDNGNLEVWTVRISDGWSRLYCLVGGDASAAEAICWTPDGRLLSAGLTGVVTLWSLAELRPVEVIDSYGGAVWAMAFDDATATLAVACEDGCIRLFDYAASGPGCMSYRCALTGFNGRSLSVVWAGPRLYASGSDGTIRCWTMLSSRALSPVCDMIISTNTGGEEGEQTLIWALAVAAEGTIVSGDSRGFTKFWDSENGTLVQEFQGHVADVLAIAVGDCGRSVFSCGADPSIVHFRCCDRQTAGGEAVTSRKNGFSRHTTRAL
jgi:U3 small nucleolar RNA-associated protein 4